jgi:hypothetical protein
MGLLERIGIGAWLLWMAVLAAVLLRRGFDADQALAPDAEGEHVRAS